MRACAPRRRSAQPRGAPQPPSGPPPRPPRSALRRRRKAGRLALHAASARVPTRRCRRAPPASVHRGRPAGRLLRVRRHRPGLVRLLRASRMYVFGKVGICLPHSSARRLRGPPGLLPDAGRPGVRLQRRRWQRQPRGDLRRQRLLVRGVQPGDRSASTAPGPRTCPTGGCSRAEPPHSGLISPPSAHLGTPEPPPGSGVPPCLPPRAQLIL